MFRQSASSAFASGGPLTVGELIVSAQSTPNMSVVLGAGRAKVPGTNVAPLVGNIAIPASTQAMYDVLNDAPITLTVAAANATNPRIDAVYIGVQDSFYSGSTNQAIPGIVTGVAAATPVAPAVPSNAILIAYIAVAANASSIGQGNISDGRTFAQLLGVPFAFENGIGSYTNAIVGGNSVNTPIYFAANRFTQPPAVYVSMSNARFTPGISNQTTSGATLSIANWSTGSGTPGAFQWWAVQATSGSTTN